MKKTVVFCTLQVEGLHSWQDCDIGEVEYLSNLHRHIFHVKAYSKVTHSDRDVEFIELKHKIKKYLGEEYWDDEFQCLYFGGSSCEMIAEELIEEFGLVQCEVNEDGENGAIVTVKKDRK